MRIKIAIALSAVIVGFGVASCIKTPRGRGLFVPRTVPVITRNADGGRTTNYATVYDVNPGLTNAFGAVQQITQGTPWGYVAQLSLGLTTGVLAWIAKKKSDQAALVPALIAGVEQGHNNSDVKTSIRRIAEQTGLEQRLNRAVKQVKSARVAQDFGRKIVK